MIQAALVLCGVLLSPVTAFPKNAHGGAPTFQQPISETGHPLNLLSNQIPLPDPKTCQHLLYVAPTLAPLLEHLSNLALEVVQKRLVAQPEAHILQIQLVKTGEKDQTPHP